MKMTEKQAKQRREIQIRYWIRRVLNMSADEILQILKKD